MEDELLKEIRELLKEQNSLLEHIKNLFEKYDEEYVEEVEKEGIVKQE